LTERIRSIQRLPFSDWVPIWTLRMITAWRRVLSAVLLVGGYVGDLAEVHKGLAFVKQPDAEVRRPPVAAGGSLLQERPDPLAQGRQLALQPGEVPALGQVAAVGGDHLARRLQQLAPELAGSALALGDLDHLPDRVTPAKLQLEYVEEAVGGVAVRDDDPTEILSQELLGRRLGARGVDSVPLLVDHRITDALLFAAEGVSAARAFPGRVLEDLIDRSGGAIWRCLPSWPGCPPALRSDSLARLRASARRSWWLIGGSEEGGLELFWEFWPSRRLRSSIRSRSAAFTISSAFSVSRSASRP
jgi:hypothetical protein